MGLYNFQKRFVPYVENGTTRHTIRAKRKHPDKPGDTTHLYTGLRTKAARLLGRSLCVKVEDIRISAAHQVFVDGVELNLDEKNALAFCDGFRTFDIRRAFEEMMAFWNGRLPFHGDIVHWSKELSLATNGPLAPRRHKPGCKFRSNRKLGRALLGRSIAGATVTALADSDCPGCQARSRA